jgi:hypothetical protein
MSSTLPTPLISGLDSLPRNTLEREPFRRYIPLNGFLFPLLYHQIGLVHELSNFTGMTLNKEPSE